MSFPGATSIREEARLAIRAKINRLHEEIRSLNSAQNELASISGLPPEILSLVFRHYRDSHFRAEGEVLFFRDRIPPTEGRLDINRWQELILPTHVCRMWRSIALDEPSLWSRLDFLSSSVVIEEMVLRSKGFPLSIRIVTTPIGLSSSWLRMMFNMENMKEFHVVLDKNNLEEVFEHSSGSSAKNLESLLIRCKQDQFYTWRKHRPHITIPRGILSQEMPHLLHFDICSCRIKWDLLLSTMPRNSELVSLRLCYVGQPSCGQFFDLLSRTTHLKTLYLTEALPEFTPRHTQNPESGEPPDVIQLSDLASCTITGSSLSQCVEFQTRVSYPVLSARLLFGPSYTEDQEYDDQQYDKSLLSILVSSFGLSLHGNGESQRPVSCLMLESKRASQSPRAMRSNRTSKFPIIATILRLWDSSVLSTLRTECTTKERLGLHLPLPSVTLDLFDWCGYDSNPSVTWLDLSIPELTEIILQGNPHDEHKWLNLFAKHPKIRHLHINSSDAMSIFSALHAGLADCSAARPDAEDDSVECTPVDDGAPPRPYICPENISLEDNLNYQGDKFDALSEYLGKRGENGAQLKWLGLYECLWMDEELVEELGQHVEQIHWLQSPASTSDDSEESDC